MATASESRVIQNLVNGAWVDSHSEETLPIPNPATGATLARVPLSTAAEVREAVAAAYAAWPAWRDTPVIERAQVLFRMKALLDTHLDELTASVTAENGKTLDEARGLGLMLGVELVSDREKRTPDAALAREVRRYCREHGVLIGVGGTEGNVIRMQPPLVIGLNDLDEALDVVAAGIESLSAAHAG